MQPTPTDKANMILIPAGPFWMGGDERADEQPAADVYVNAFWIDPGPVTNAQFRPFWESGAYDDPNAPCWEGLQAGYQWIRHNEERRVPRFLYDPQWNGDDLPIVGVTWYEAAAFARWAGKRLPTEAEWEKAARGPSTGAGPGDARQYPWGNEFDAQRCNVAATGIGRTTVTDHFSPAGDSPYGVMQMAGNVWEWTSSLYRPYPYNADDGRENLAADAGVRVLRGGSWQSRFTQHVRCCNRFFGEPNFGFTNTGFRCAMTGEE